MLKCIGMWNVEWKIPHSNSYSRILECGMWNCPFQNINFHSNHAKVHWNVECGMGKSIPHSKILEWELEQFHIPHSRILEWNWNVDFHSTFQIPYSKPLEFELESELGIHLHSKFHSIPIPLCLSQTYLQCCSILSSIPIPQWMEWNVESRFDTGCCLHRQPVHL